MFRSVTRDESAGFGAASADIRNASAFEDGMSENVRI